MCANGKDRVGTTNPCATLLACSFVAFATLLMVLLFGTYVDLRSCEKSQYSAF